MEWPSNKWAMMAKQALPWWHPQGLRHHQLEMINWFQKCIVGSSSFQAPKWWVSWGFLRKKELAFCEPVSDFSKINKPIFNNVGFNIDYPKSGLLSLLLAKKTTSWASTFTWKIGQIYVGYVVPEILSPKMRCWTHRRSLIGLKSPKKSPIETSTSHWNEV